MATALFLTYIFIILLSQHSDAATPQRQRLTNLEYVYRYGTSRPTELQTFDQINNSPSYALDETQKAFSVQQQQQDTSIASNEIPLLTNDKGVHYNEEKLLSKSSRPYWAGGYYGTPSYKADLEPKYGVYQNTPALTRQPSYGTHPTRHLPSTPVSQIIYAPRPQNYNELQAPTLVHPFPDNASNSRNMQHKVYSNQKQYAPKRPPDANVPHHMKLPYPPSFVSITSTTSTTAAPPAVAGLNSLPDVFAARQHKSLLDSYIPSWVLMRMLQQQKLLQNKQLHQYVATHTLAYPSSRKIA